MSHVNKKAEDGNILVIKKSDQYRTADELIKKSQPNSVYYTLLIISSIIIASGLLLDNSAIVIGGMLVTPVLTPVLLIALGLAIGELKSIKNTAVLMGKSFLIIFLASFFLSLIFGTGQEIKTFDNSMTAAVLYFIVALAAGAAATFGWARKDLAEVLPGIAISVSLVPPISLAGIGLSRLSFTTVQFYFVVTFFNLLGVIIGGLVVFSLLKFYKIEKRVEADIKEIEKNHKPNTKK